MANSSLIKSLENIMRIDDGVDGDSQYIGQITWMLFLKAFDAKEMEWEFKPGYKGIIPVGYRWRDWADDKEGITGDALIKFVGELFEKLKNLDTSDGDMRKYVVRNVFEDINNYMKSGIQLRKLINAINEKVDFNDAKKRHMFNELYEDMLRDLQSAGQAGEYYTPRPVTNFIVEKVDPKLGEIVLDPACGTGGFLTSTIAHFGSIQSTEELAMLQKSINGWEKKPLPFLLAMTNLILHDIEIPALRHQNSLSKPLSEYSAKDRVDVIVANPPFGGAEDKSVKNNFPSEFQTSETADLFMALIMHLLKDKGRCGIVLPNGFMLGTAPEDKIKKNIKEKLLKEYGLHTIIRLPQVFKPNADVYTNLLFFQKGVASRGVWFYRLDYPEGVKSFTKTKPLQDKHFDPVREWWDDKKPLIVDGMDKARFFTIDELIELNYDFDKCCPFPHEEEEVLEPLELVMRYREQRNELNKELNRTLEHLVACLNKGVVQELEGKEQIISQLAQLDSEFSEKIKKSILTYALCGKLSSQFETDEPALDLLKRIKKYRENAVKNGELFFDKKHTADEIGADDIPYELPPAWEWVRFADIVSFNSGKTPARQDTASWSDGTYPWVSIADMVSGGITLDTKEKVSKKAILESFSGKMSPAGTMIMSYKLTIGKMSILGMDAVHNEAIISIYPTACESDSEVLKDYLFTVLPLIAMTGDSKNAVKGKTLNATSISNLMIPLPPIEEQKRIVARVNELLAVCDGLK